MHVVTVEQSTSSPVDDVAAVVNDMARWPEWMGVSDVTIEGQGAQMLAVGTRYTVRAGPIRDLYEIVAFDPPLVTRYRLIAGTLPVRDYCGETTLEPAANGGTLVRWRVTFRPQFAGTGWLLERMIAAQFRRALRALAARVDNGPNGDRP